MVKKHAMDPFVFFSPVNPQFLRDIFWNKMVTLCS